MKQHSLRTAIVCIAMITGSIAQASSFSFETVFYVSRSLMVDGSYFYAEGQTSVLADDTGQRYLYDHKIYPDQVGVPVLLTGADFDFLASMFTDGLGGTFTTMVENWSLGIGQGRNWTEAHLFWGAPNAYLPSLMGVPGGPVPGPDGKHDLQGNSISSISVTVTHFDFDPVYSIGRAEELARVNATYHIEFQPVPDASGNTMFLWTMLGLLGAARCMRRRADFEAQ